MKVFPISVDISKFSVGRQQSVRYELNAGTVNKTDPLYTVQQRVG